MADRNHLILTAVGPDQIGLVEKISEFIAHHGCNIEDSKMAVFCGEFALIILISGDSGNLHKIANHYRELEIASGLAISIKTPTSRKPTESFLPYTLTASCMDHPGIVYLITGILSSFGVNIESMETKTYAAPVSGTPIFRLDADISVPTKTNINALTGTFCSDSKRRKYRHRTYLSPWKPDEDGLRWELSHCCWQSNGSNTDSVKPLRVGRQNRFLVDLRQIFARQQLIDFLPTRFRAKAFMREIGGKQKRFVARFFHREA